MYYFILKNSIITYLKWTTVYFVAKKKNEFSEHTIKHHLPTGEINRIKKTFKFYQIDYKFRFNNNYNINI